MNNFERVRKLVDEHVSVNGTETVMSGTEFLEWVNDTYKHISKDNGNFFPTDICYDLYNIALKDFPGPNLCLLCIERSKFKLVGSGYKYTGPTYRYRGRTNEEIVGNWEDGIYSPVESSDKGIPVEYILSRRKDLEKAIRIILKESPVSVDKNDREIKVQFAEMSVVGVSVEDEGYKLFDICSEWVNETTYLCEEADDGRWFYYLDTIDECIGELGRLKEFLSQNQYQTIGATGRHKSELSKILSSEAFRQGYIRFIEQADRNKVSRKAQGSSIPFGFSQNSKCDGDSLSQKFGQGAPSLTPYMNWWVVSVYYLTENEQIILGIEENRYTHLKEMKVKPLRYEMIGNKKTSVAVFYATSKTNVDYNELYEKFITVCEEVMRLGLR